MPSGEIKRRRNAAYKKGFADGVASVSSPINRLPGETEADHITRLLKTAGSTQSPQTLMLVKPLDWESSENVRLEWAESVVGQYRVHCGFEMDGKSYAPAFRFPNDSEWVTCASLEAAKDKAQEHYEARIRSALTPSPSSKAGVPTDDDLVKIADAAFAQAYVGGKAYHGHPAGMRAAVLAVLNADSPPPETTEEG